ncbi:Putative serine/threonine-protein kinase-like protein CCR3 [Linum grandiflorum]
MKNPPSSPVFFNPAAFSAFTAAVFVVSLLSFPSISDALGVGSTLAVTSSGNPTVCGIVSDQPTQSLVCYRGIQNQTVALPPNISFTSISGGRDFVCGIRFGGYNLLCWNTFSPNNNDDSDIFIPKRVFHNTSTRLLSVSVGDDQICSVTTNASGAASCWRGDEAIRAQLGGVAGGGSNGFVAISSGFGFSCGILVNGSVIRCWGTNPIARRIESEFGNMTMLSVQAGGSHVCGVNSTGILVCKGDNSSGQLNVPSNFSSTPLEYSLLALGANHSCALRQIDSSILPLPRILPGPCVDVGSTCDGESYSSSASWCGNVAGLGVCKPSKLNISTPIPPPTQSPPSESSRSPSRALTRGLLAFAIIGSVGIFSGICTVIYCVWNGQCCLGRKKIHNSVQPTITRAGSNGGPMRRQRSGTSAADNRAAEEFTFSELSSATNGFSPENKIGGGSYGVVYKGKLSDGREVAIKRGETSKKAKKYQEKESAFESELSFLSRLHHKHLVRLVGFCDDGEDEKLLVYEYMKNGALYDHLHNSDEKSNGGGVMNSWKMRIKVALDAARGIDYLHNYAVPPIIHRDIKSSNILLDGNWVARVSDFGLSLLGPDPADREFRPTKAAGTVGYIDPEYYSLNVLTAKSDVYGLGVVLLELLTGKRAIFKSEEDGTPTSIVEYAAGKIAAGELWGILDSRVRQPDVNESEAVELVGYTAMHCVSVEGKDRPTMGDVVVNLERALVLCDGSHGSISSGSISIVSE